MTLAKPLRFSATGLQFESIGAYGALYDDPTGVALPSFGFQALDAGHAVGFSSFSGTQKAWAQDSGLGFLGSDIEFNMTAGGFVAFNDSATSSFFQIQEATQWLLYTNGDFSSFTFKTGAEFLISNGDFGVRIQSISGLLNQISLETDTIVLPTNASQLQFVDAKTLLTRSADGKLLLDGDDGTPHKVWLQFGGTSASFPALTDGSLTDGTVGLLLRTASNSAFDNFGCGSLLSSSYIATALGAGYGMILNEGGGYLGLGSSHVLQWSSISGATGTPDIQAGRAGAGDWVMLTDAGAGLTTTLELVQSAAANDTAMLLLCNITGVQTLKRVVRDPVTHILSAP